MTSALSTSSSLWRDAAGRLRRSAVLSFITLTAIFFLVGTTIAYRSLSYPWFSVDLHLVRLFSGSELRQVLTGNWDPDGVETPGYRPATVLFNHARAAVFDESVLAHRLFEISLLAASLSILAMIAMELGMNLGPAILGGIFAICTKNNWWNLVWISDGIHAFVGLALILSAYFAFSAAKRFAVWKIALTTFFAAVGLFAREEALSMFPVIVLVISVWVLVRKADPFTSAEKKETRFRDLWRSPPDFPWQLIGVVALLLVAMAALFSLLRIVFIGAIQPDLLWQNLIKNIVVVAHPMGLYPPAAGLEDSFELLFVLWLLTLGFLIGTNLFFAPTAPRVITLFWLTASLLTMTPGLIVARPNLLFLPISFFSFAVAHMLGHIARASRNALIAASSIIAVVLVVSTYCNIVAQELVHPLSFEYLRDNAEFVWGVHSHARIPPSRINELKREFSQLGIESQQDFDRLFPSYVKQAADLQLSRPNPEGKPFEPRIGFLQP